MISDRTNETGTRCCTPARACANVQPRQNVGNEKSSPRDTCYRAFLTSRVTFFTVHALGLGLEAGRSSERPAWGGFVRATTPVKLPDYSFSCCFNVQTRPNTDTLSHKFAITVSPQLSTVFRACQVSPFSPRLISYRPVCEKNHREIARGKRF